MHSREQAPDYKSDYTCLEQEFVGAGTALSKGMRCRQRTPELHQLRCVMGAGGWGRSCAGRWRGGAVRGRAGTGRLHGPGLRPPDRPPRLPCRCWRAGQSTECCNCISKFNGTTFSQARAKVELHNKSTPVTPLRTTAHLCFGNHTIKSLDYVRLCGQVVKSVSAS